MDIFELMYEKYKLPNKPKLFEAFAGVGCQRMAFNRLGLDYEMVGISEIDKYAISSYIAIHGETKNFGSIMDIKGSDLPEIDVFTYSFPCTDLSKAGKQKGLSENTRSGLVYEVLRILHELYEFNRLPKVLIMENVIDLVQIKFIKQFQEIQLELEQLGYSNYTETLNAKDYGVAQNRDRVFMVSILGEYSYTFPKQIKLENRLKDYLEDNVDEKYYLTETSLNGLTEAIKRHGGDIDEMTNNEKELNVIQYPRGENKGGLISDITSPTIDGSIGARNTALLCIRIGELFDDEKGKHQAGSIWDTEALSPTIDTMQGGYRQPMVFVKEATEQGYSIAHEGDSINLAQPNSKTRRGRVGEQISQTLTCQSSIAVVEPSIRIRKLTPRECWRLMGIDDEDFDKASQVCSNSQLYKQAGNGIVVDVFAYIIKNMC